MESNKFHSNKHVGGYSTHNLAGNSNFFAPKVKKVRLSFKLHEISIINDSEILKLKLNNDLICRIMKFDDEETNIQSITFDLVDETKKEIVFKANRIFHNAAGIGGFLMSHNFVTQWEIVPVDKICKAFLIGNKEDFLSLIDIYNIKISQSVDWYIKNNLE